MDAPAALLFAYPAKPHVLDDLFGYPDDLPDLSKLRPPVNTRPGGVADCYYRQRSEGRLAAIY